MTLFLRQRNEALDEDKKVLRQQLGIYKQQLQRWNPAKEDESPGIMTFTSADYFKLKILISNFSEAVNQIIQNWNKGDFVGVGSLQKTYESIARFVKDIVGGPYLTADKERVLSLVNKVVPTLQSVNGLAAEDAFSASEKILVKTILNNITEKTFEPIGFLPIPSEEERTTEKRLRRGQTKIKTDRDYVELVRNLKDLEEVSKDDKKLSREVKTLIKRLAEGTKAGQITKQKFDNIIEKYTELQAQAPEVYTEEVLPTEIPLGFISIDDPEYDNVVGSLQRISSSDTEKIRIKAGKILDELQEKSPNNLISESNFQKINAKVAKLAAEAEAAAAAPTPRTRATTPKPVRKTALTAAEGEA